MVDPLKPRKPRQDQTFFTEYDPGDFFFWLVIILVIFLMAALVGTVIWAIIKIVSYNTTGMIL